MFFLNLHINFAIGASIFGAFLIGAGLFCLRILPRDQTLWRTLPRERIIGIIMGFICLYWSAYHVNSFLEGNMLKFRSYLPVIVIAITILSYSYLDYLFVRGLGGLLLLFTTWMLHEGFVIHLPFRPIFSLMCYGFGVYGIFIIAVPYSFRDLLEKITLHIRYQWIVSLSLIVVGSYSLIMGLTQR